MMAFQVSVTLLVVILFSISVYHEIDGSRNIFTDNDFELEEQLKIHNKPSIKSIKDETGALYDCIDIHKQPSLDHPLLKDHKVQMTPTSPPQEFINESRERSRIALQLQLQHVECPEGTVPIRRVQKKDLIKAKYAMEAQSFDIHPSTAEYPGAHGAGVYSTVQGTFKGAQADINIPEPKVLNDQTISAFIELSSIATGTRIIAGWIVSPNMYGDHRARSVIFWKGAWPGCYNLLCKGFVHVNSRVPVDAVLNTSVYDGKQWELQLKIHQDPSTKTWWLTYPKAEITLGYWPGELLPGLAEGGSRLVFQGYTRGQVNGNSPPMGYGKYPDEDFRHSGYFADMLIVNKDNRLADLGDDWSGFLDNPKCYRVKYYGQHPVNGYSLAYGGPGGDCGP